MRITLSIFLFLIAMTSYGGEFKCDDLDTQAQKDGGFHPTLWGTVIGSGRAYFHTAPDSKCKENNIFVIKGDHLTILTSFPASGPMKWLYVSYINGKAKVVEDEVIEGWIPASRIKIGGQYGQ